MNIIIYNVSGRFCGIAQMTSVVSFDNKKAAAVWPQDKRHGHGFFHVKWIFIKDIPNRNLSHILLPYVIFMYFIIILTTIITY